MLLQIAQYFIFIVSGILLCVCVCIYVYIYLSVSYTYIYIYTEEIYIHIFYIYIYVYRSCFIHLSVDGHLGCCHILAIVNNASMNIGMHVSF